MAQQAQYPELGALWGALPGGDLYPYLTGIPFTQPDGIGGTVYPQQWEYTWFSGGVILLNKTGMLNGQYMFPCGHSCNSAEVFQYSGNDGNTYCGYRCPFCSFALALGYTPGNLPPIFIG